MYLVLSATLFTCTCIKGVCEDGPQSQEDDREDEERPGVSAGVHGEDQRRTGEGGGSIIPYLLCSRHNSVSAHSRGAGYFIVLSRYF